MFSVEKEQINELVKQELDGAKKKYGLFKSHQEKAFVIETEFTEAKNEIDIADIEYRDYKENIQRYNYGNSYDHLMLLRQRCQNAILELIQVMAMCDKEVKDE